MVRKQRPWHTPSRCTVVIDLVFANCRIQNAFCCGVAILQHGLTWRRRPETLSRVNYKQTLRVFLTIVIYRVIVGSLVTSFSHVKVLPSFWIVLYSVLLRWQSSYSPPWEPEISHSVLLLLKLLLSLLLLCTMYIFIYLCWLCNWLLQLLSQHVKIKNWIELNCRDWISCLFYLFCVFLLLVFNLSELNLIELLLQRYSYIF
jgi:hypothetical protein